jgi:NAD+--asparagine ADP-ribosyltransferase
VKEGKLEAGNENIGNVRYASTYKARLDQTPKDGSKGEWTGERGESTYKSTDTKANEILKKDGVNGVKYKDAIPDFSPVSKGEVKIDGMTNNRQKNFDKADAALAKEKGLTPKEIKRWREENELTWHECNDMQTMQAVPTEINSTFGHLGGVGEINAAAKEP